MCDERFEELLSLYVDGAAAPADLEELAARLRENAECRRVFRERMRLEAALFDMFETLPVPQKKTAYRKRSRRAWPANVRTIRRSPIPWIAAAASIAVAVLGFIFLGAPARDSLIPRDVPSVGAAGHRRHELPVSPQAKVEEPEPQRADSEGTPPRSDSSPGAVQTPPTGQAPGPVAQLIAPAPPQGAPLPSTPSPTPKPAVPERPTEVTLARVHVASGMVLRLADGRKLRVSQGDEILSGQGLECPDYRSTVELAFPEGSRMELRGPVLVEKLSGSGADRRVEVTYGKLTAHCVPRQPSSRILFLTPHAEVDVLGTVLRVVVEPGALGWTRVEVEKGRVRVTSKHTRKAAEVHAGDLAFVGPDLRRVSRAQPLRTSFQDGVSPGPSYRGTQDTTLTTGQTRPRGRDPVIVADGRVESSKDPQNSHSSILIRWDLTDLALGSAVHEAILDLDVTDHSAGQVYELFEVRRDWVEGEASWLQYAAGREWQEPGASGLEDRGTVPLARLAATSRGPLSVRLGPKAFEVVRRWISDPSTNQGFILVGTTQTNSLEFSSRESTVPEKRPRLTIAHSLPR